jgi:uncharacterized protein YkwD
MPLGRRIACRIDRIARAATIAAIAGCAAGSTGRGASAPGTLPRAENADFARIEAEVLRELNRVRTDPNGYAAIVEGLLPLYSGNLLRRPGWPSPVRTVEGATAAREAISVLRTQSPLGALSPTVGLTAAARDLVRDQGATGNTGHVGSNGSTTASRIADHGTWSVSYAENIDYAPVIGGRDVIEDFLIDDGVADRAHRRNVFQVSARVIGIACGPHPRYGTVCVLVQAGGFTGR